jgi:hypothetical protein
MKIRTYSELITLPTFEERYEYLRLGGTVGEETFGFDRWLNQRFYTSDKEYLAARAFCITRDAGLNDYCQDLGMPRGHDIHGRIIVHHMNPITKEDILNRTKFLLDPEYMICTIDNTHRAIHYGDRSLLISAPIERTPHDTCPWKKL